MALPLQISTAASSAQLMKCPIFSFKASMSFDSEMRKDMSVSDEDELGQTVMAFAGAMAAKPLKLGQYMPFQQANKRIAPLEKQILRYPIMSRSADATPVNEQ